ncbi:hypothetical protein PPACK8108_LOCUS21998 [Phakopsora pachyrhizi]|uniref:Asparagine synthetase domain-containing protein n=1 Tax=Phakopsora pachyrhizi TaxID=170000 RepID=A0AAV0BMP5_PHAPC|nr:hypothetical protein PPACK8108_LOCUS21998 [Phakopsora pachyrhizi]
MVLEATFYASVLHLCGSRLISQPMSSNRSDSLFLWNSEIFDGILVPEDCGQILFERLENRSDCILVLDVMKGVKGPYALIYYNSKIKKIWFGRDPLGRINIPTKHDQLKFIQLEDQTFSPEFLKASRLLRDTLDDSVKRMVAGISSLYQKTEKKSNVTVLFSGGLDCTTLAFLVHSHIPPSESIDLLNVAFENTQSISNNHQTKTIETDSERSCVVHHNYNNTFDVPDCWIAEKVDDQMIEYAEHEEKTIELMRPNLTVMNLSIAAALYFAAQGIGSSQLNNQKGFLGTSVTNRTLAQLVVDLKRILTQNLGRDDWMMSWFGWEVRYPLLDRRVIDLLSGLPVHLKCNHGLGKGLGDNLLLRGLAHGLRLVESCRLSKQAIQFDAQSAKLDGNPKGQAG